MRKPQGERREWYREGSLLNASTRGLACLIDGQGPSPLLVGLKLEVDFQLRLDGPLFRLDARVVSVTPGRRTDSYVVGLELTDNEKQRTQLKELQAGLCGAV